TSPSWTFRQIRPSASRSVPTTITCVPSRTDLTTAEPVPGSTRILTAGFPLPITSNRSGSGVGATVWVGEAVAVAVAAVVGGTGDSVAVGTGGGWVGRSTTTVAGSGDSASGEAVGLTAGGGAVQATRYRVSAMTAKSAIRCRNPSPPAPLSRARE